MNEYEYGFFYETTDNGFLTSDVQYVGERKEGHVVAIAKHRRVSHDPIPTRDQFKDQWDHKKALCEWFRKSRLKPLVSDLNEFNYFKEKHEAYAFMLDASKNGFSVWDIGERNE